MKLRNHNDIATRLTLFISPVIVFVSLSALAADGGSGAAQENRGFSVQRRIAVWDCRSEPFRQDSFAVSGDQAKCLDEAVIYLGKNPGSSIIVEGHANPEEKSDTSLKRANSARDYLIFQKGVDDKRIIVKNFCANCKIDYKEVYRNSRIEVGVVMPSTNTDPPRFTISKCLSPKEAVTCNVTGR